MSPTALTADHLDPANIPQRSRRLDRPIEWDKTPVYLHGDAPHPIL
jgi:hypothetical protein